MRNNNSVDWVAAGGASQDSGQYGAFHAASSAAPGSIHSAGRRHSATEENFAASMLGKEGATMKDFSTRRPSESSRISSANKIGFEPRRKSATEDQLLGGNSIDWASVAAAAGGGVSQDSGRCSTFHAPSSSAVPSSNLHSGTGRRHSATEDNFATGVLGKGGAKMKDFSFSTQPSELSRISSTHVTHVQQHDGEKEDVEYTKHSLVLCCAVLNPTHENRCLTTSNAENNYNSPPLPLFFNTADIEA